MGANDGDAVQAVLDPDWVVITANGDIADGIRDSLCAAIRSGGFVRTTYDVDLSSARVRLYGDLAVITFKLTYSGSLGGKSFPPMKQVQTDVLKWDGGAWKAVLSHETRVVEN